MKATHAFFLQYVSILIYHQLLTLISIVTKIIMYNGSVAKHKGCYFDIGLGLVDQSIINPGMTTHASSHKNSCMSGGYVALHDASIDHMKGST